MTSIHSNLEFEQELDKLRTAYLGALPEKVTLIRNTWNSIRKQDISPKAWSHIHRLIHNLAGGSGIYDLYLISKKARELLDLMQPLLDGSNPLNHETLSKIEDAIQVLEQTTTMAISEKSKELYNLRRPPVYNPPTQVSNGEIFLIEDDAEQANFLTLVLRQAGHSVHHFSVLQEVISAIGTQTPAAIITDIIFPDGNLAGIQMMAAVRGELALQIPIIFISSRADMEARLHAVRAGAWHYFTKPVHVNGLLRLLNTYIKPKKNKTKRILLVDEDLAMSTFFGAHLEKTKDFETFILSEPLRLLETLEAFRPHLILMDYHMPECNGLELTAVVRQHETFADTPVIFLTEDTHVETRLTALTLGSDDYFTKSMGPDRLVLAVQSRLSRLEHLIYKDSGSAWYGN